MVVRGIEGWIFVLGVDTTEGPGEAAVEDEAKKIEDDASDNDPAHRGGFPAGVDRLVEREDQRDADDEDEHREDQVIEVEAGPEGVVDLLHRDFGPPVMFFGVGLGDGPDDLFPADDPEHVEAAERVQRNQARNPHRLGLRLDGSGRHFGGGRCCGHRSRADEKIRFGADNAKLLAKVREYKRSRGPSVQFWGGKLRKGTKPCSDGNSWRYRRRRHWG